LFLFLFVCFYPIFEDKFECIALSCFSFVVVVGFEGLKTGLPREFPVFVLIFFFFFASILQKVVSKMEEAEHALYNRVRAAEMQRRKQEQDVQRLINELESLTKENDKRMKVLGLIRLEFTNILKCEKTVFILLQIIRNP